jgi:hypothetical protein
LDYYRSVLAELGHATLLLVLTNLTPRQKKEEGY